MAKILHIGSTNKFVNPFIEVVKKAFNFHQHEFLLLAKENSCEKYDNVHIFRLTKIEMLKYYLFAILKMHRAEKIILHGLFDSRLIVILFCAPWLLKKCHWVMWGGDLYSYALGEKKWKWKSAEFFRRGVIRNMGFLVTYLKGDVELARQWYGAKGKYIECLMYPSNVYTVPPSFSPVVEKNTKTLNILLGNSADPSNNHPEVLLKLAAFKEKDINIFAPLSYGNPDYAKQIVAEGRAIFGDKFQALTEFIVLDAYLKMLAEIDIAVFNHRRQQAMGNTIVLLGLGKKVFMRADTVQWSFFQELGVCVYNINELKDLVIEDESTSLEKNVEIVKKFFSEEKMIDQLAALFI